MNGVADITTGRAVLITAGILLSLSMILLMSIHTIDETDMGFHLSMGRWIQNHRSIPTVDPLTYTGADREYLDMHWLYQLSAWLVWSWGGAAGYILFHALFIVSAFYLSIRDAIKRQAGITVIKRQVSITSIMLLTFLGTLASEIRFSVRPEVISWTFLMVFITILESYRKNQSGKLWVLPLLMLFWVNIQGIYIIGLGTVASYLLGDVIHRRSFSKPLWLYGIATALVCLLNPYHLKGVMFPFLLATRLGGNNPFALNIGEFLSPYALNPLDFKTGISFLLFSYYFLAILVPVLLILTARKRHPSEWIIIVVFGILAAQALRNIPLYFLVSLPIATAALTDIHEWLKQRIQFFRTHQQRLHLWGFALAALLILTVNLLILNGSWHHLTQRTVRFGTGIAGDFLPVEASEFLNRHSIKGRILNDLRFGGYLSWVWDQPVFIDGRLEVMSPELFAAYDSARHTQNPWPLLAQYQPEIALFGYATSPGWFSRFNAAPDWRLVHLDTHVVIFFKSGFRDDIVELTSASIVHDVLNGHDEPVSTHHARDILLQHAPPGKGQYFLKLFTGLPAKPRDLINRSNALLMMGSIEQSKRLLLQAIQDSDGFSQNAWNRLGMLYFKTENYELAYKCFQKLVFADANHQNALLQLERIRIRLSSGISGAE